ncbi:hypothetical protein KUTeg_002098 [Tegillarca granosa]|uniref:Uncharacterized protein n=1 Tax=Tegillarca granosa TaxID=220873 RepID=A0ABQ9FTD6_TEGGR|nr:hypothetical protein KUTeg_002098 [Tegillarca granosa]
MLECDTNKVFFYFLGRIIVNLKHGHNGFMLKILKTNSHNPIHNIRILLPGYEERYKFFPFNKIFLEPLRRYSEIRFMDFLHTNGHTPEPTTWASRRLSSYHTQEGTNGGSIEYMIDICNILGANPWFNMPHAADDNYVTSFAEMVKKKLRPDLKVYVEYSNEVWNGIFRQTHYTQEEGMKRHLDTHSWKAGMKYYNIRSAEIANLWKSAALLLNLTMDGIASYCENDTNRIESGYRDYMEVAKNHSVKLLMYEGGPAIMENSAIAHGVSHDLVTQKAIEFNRDSHIEPVVYNVLESWRRIVANDINNNSPGLNWTYPRYRDVSLGWLQSVNTPDVYTFCG